MEKLKLKDVLRSDKKVKSFFDFAINQICSITKDPQEITIMSNHYLPSEVYEKLSPIDYKYDLYEFKRALIEIQTDGDFDTEFVSNQHIKEWIINKKGGWKPINPPPLNY